MSQAVPRDWWTALSAQEFRLIVQSAIAIPGIDDIFEQGEIGRVMIDRIPRSPAAMFSAGTMQPEGLRLAYLNAFRAYLETNAEGDDTGPSGVISHWSMLTSKPLVAGDIELGKAILSSLKPRFEDFRSAVAKLCGKIGNVVKDERVTGLRKPGRVWLDHRDDDLEKIEGRDTYVTVEGHRAHKRSGFGLGSGGRGDEDWRIMIDRATRQVQSVEATRALLERIDDRGDPTLVWSQIALLRDTLLGLKAQVVSDEFQGAVASAADVWRKAEADGGRFAAIPKYAADRVTRTMGLLRAEEGKARKVLDAAVAIHANETDGAGTWKTLNNPVTRGEGERELNEKLAPLRRDAVRAVQGYLKAFLAVHDAIVDGSQQFLDWLLEWTEVQQEKGFRTEHFAMWAGCEVATLLLGATALATRVTLTVLSLGTAELIAAPVFIGSDILLGKITDAMKNARMRHDLKGLSEEEIARRYLGKEYRTAQERLLRTLHGGLEKAGAGVEKLFTAQDLQDGVVVTVKELGAVAEAIQKHLDADKVEGIKAQIEELEHILNPISMAGPVADGVLSGVTGGVKLTIRLVDDVIMVFVPPKLTQVLSDDAIARLEQALHRAVGNLDELERRALHGDLMVRRLDLAARFEVGGGDVDVTILAPDGQRWQADVDLDPATMRVVWSDVDRLLRMLTTAVITESRVWLPPRWKVSDVDLQSWVYARAAGASVAGDDYKPRQDGHDTDTAIVRFAMSDLLVAAGGGGTFHNDRYVFAGLTGQPMTGRGREWGRRQGGYSLTVTAEGRTTYADGPSRGSAKAKAKGKAASAATVAAGKSDLASLLTAHEAAVGASAAPSTSADEAELEDAAV